MACEHLEHRALLTAVVPAMGRGSLAAEVRPVGQAAPPPKAPSIFIEPTAGRQPILDAIASAQNRIRLGICSFTDPVISDALIAAAA